MTRHEVRVEVLGPWSLATSRAFWEGLAPAALTSQGKAQRLRSVFCLEGDRRRADAQVNQEGSTVTVVVTGEGDLEAATRKACRFLSLDVDARGWPDGAVQAVQAVKGLGPFAAELVVVRGANAPDALPSHERRLEAEVAERYGPDRPLAEVSEAWRPFRTWAAVHLRTLRVP